MTRFLGLFVVGVLGLSLGGCDLFNMLGNSTSPTNLSASKGSGSGISLSWTAPNFSSDPSTSVNGYAVYRDGSEVATVSGTSWYDGSGAAGTEYSYYVTASLSGSGASVSGPSNMDTGWYVPSQPLVFGEAYGTVSTSAQGWFETILVQGWTYQFQSRSVPTNFYICNHDDPESRTFGGLVQESQPLGWISDRTGKVWIYFDSVSQVCAWY